jgi:hypothetical protein
MGTSTTDAGIRKGWQAMGKTRIKNGDAVLVKSKNRIGIIIDIQFAFDRYQLQGVSDWQYGVADLVRLDTNDLVDMMHALQIAAEVDKRFADVVLQERKLAWQQNESDAYTLKMLSKTLSNVQAAWLEQKEQIRSLEHALSLANNKNGDDYYAWIPYAENHLETLSMPVLIEADWIRQLIALAVKESRITLDGEET